jgi:ATP/maltotriose-dependent transcriptional regulator MalT
MATEVIGRDEELGAIESFLADVERGPAALVLSGEPGIGKTILWEAGVQQATERFGCVLSHQSAEAEALLAFGGLSDLLSPVLEDVLRALAPPRRRALEVALWLTDPGELPPEPAAIGLAFLDVLKQLAGRGPILVALDDLQWLDTSSALVVALALRRLRDEPVGTLATLRKAPETTAPFELDRVFPEERLRWLSLDPVSLGALDHLLRKRLGIDLARPELTRVLETSGGNPFFALELGRELARTETRPGTARTISVPESLRELLGGRLARLPPETADALVHAAALARPTVDIVARAFGETERIAGALDTAVEEGVISIDDARIRFAHPLLASICYEQAPPGRRRAVHAALAGAVTDPEERARHLARAAEGPDGVVASELEVAAESAAARGAPAGAAEFFQLAAELTPGDPPEARRRRLRAANLHRLAGSGERATAMLEQLLAETPAGLERADVLFALASIWNDRQAMLRLCDEALDEAKDDDARSARILAFRSWVFSLDDVRSALVDGKRALAKAERVADPALLAVVIAQLGAAETHAAEMTPGLLERGVAIEERLEAPLGFHESPRVALARRLIRLGEPARAQAILEEAAAAAAAHGDEQTRAELLWTLSFVEWQAGRWQQGLEHATLAYELSDQIHVTMSRALAGRNKALIETDLGLVEQARASAEDALAASRASSSERFAIWNLGVLGRLELELGDLAAAGTFLRDLPGRLVATRAYDPSLPVWTDAIEAMIALGELEEAREYLELYDVHAERLGSSWSVSAAARCRGLLCAAEGDLDAAFAAFERALVELDDQPFPLERGRTLLCLGTVRRQAGQKRPARDALEQALAIFEELGARLWAEKARRELRRISGRRAAADDLTETELRVAELAARGRSNKEIAAELFMGVSTVEMHLSRVYRKLGVRRAGLARRLAMADETAGV